MKYRYVLYFYAVLLGIFYFIKIVIPKFQKKSVSPKLMSLIDRKKKQTKKTILYLLIFTPTAHGTSNLPAKDGCSVSAGCIVKLYALEEAKSFVSAGCMKGEGGSWGGGVRSSASAELPRDGGPP